jgi:hypothetical protein
MSLLQQVVNLVILQKPSQDGKANVIKLGTCTVEPCPEIIPGGKYVCGKVDSSNLGEVVPVGLVKKEVDTDGNDKVRVLADLQAVIGMAPVLSFGRDMAPEAELHTVAQKTIHMLVNLAVICK